jgi:hypothetical protein
MSKNRRAKKTNKYNSGKYFFVFFLVLILSVLTGIFWSDIRSFMFTNFGLFKYNNITKNLITNDAKIYEKKPASTINHSDSQKPAIKNNYTQQDRDYLNKIIDNN